MLDILPYWITRSLNDPILTTNPKLTDKVSGDRLKPYFGSTVVFTLDEQTRTTLKKLQDLLYQAAGNMLAEPLTPDSFHMTVHPLIDGPNPTPIRYSMDVIAPKAHEIISAYQRFHPEPLHMRTTTIFNMTHTSLVLGLYPTESPSWQRLNRLYEDFQQIPRLHLNHDLTPHITLAYFRPGTYSESDLKLLRQITGIWTGIPIQLCAEDLVYQEFTDMNHYTTVAP